MNATTKNAKTKNAETTIRYITINGVQINIDKATTAQMKAFLGYRPFAR